MGKHTYGLYWKRRRTVGHPPIWPIPAALMVSLAIFAGPTSLPGDAQLATRSAIQAQNLRELPKMILSESTESSSMDQPSSSQCGFYGAAFGPAGAVYDYARNEIFVADSETNDVYIISGANQTILKVISLGRVCVNPFGVAYDADLGEVFVAEAGNATIAAISDTSDSVVASFPVQGQPWNIAFDSGLDQLFVTDPVHGNISVLSLPTGTLVATITEGWEEQPVGLSYDANLGEVFVANSLGNYSSTMSVISDATDSLVAYVPVHCWGPGSSGTFGEMPYETAYDYRTGNVYVSCEAGSGLEVIATSNNTQVGYVPLNDGTTALAYDADRGEVWAAAPFSGHVYSVSDETNLVVHWGRTGGTPFEGLAIDNRTGDVYVTNWKQANVTVFDPNASPIAGITLPTLPAPASESVTATAWLLILGSTAVLVAISVAVWIRVHRPPNAPSPPAEGTQAATPEGK